jgi:hypothetical protein
MAQSKVLAVHPAFTGAQALVLPLFSDIRPLRGIIGTVDWYLDGMVSSMIVNGHISGQRGEHILLSAPRLFPTPRILVIGVGPYRKNGSFADIEYYHQAGRMLVTLGIRDAAVGLLEREGPTDPEIVLRYLLDEIPASMQREEGFKVLLVAPA